MFKPFALTLSVAVGLVAGNVAKAGGHGHAAPSPQVIASPQVVATEQCAPAYTECAVPAKKCFDLSGLGCKLSGLKHGIKNCIPTIHIPKPKPKCYSYEWVLKKKRCGGGLLGGCGKHGATEECGYADPGVYATGQNLGSPQGVYAAGQGGTYGTGQAGTFGTGQIYGGGATGQIPAAVEVAPGVMEPAPVDTDAAPEAPVVPSSYRVGR